MKTDKFKSSVEKLLSLAGIGIDGNNPWDLRVHNENFYRRILTHGSLGLGESYMDGWWDCDQVDEFFCRILRSEIHNKVNEDWILLFKVLLSRIINMQSKRRAFQIGERHYDLGNDLYENMLDRRMVYTCAYWKDAHTLNDAQEHKLELVCRKTGLTPGMKILDIGCGWGSFAKYAAEKYKVEVTGITVSREQVELARTLCKGEPVEIRLQDYRDVTGKFDCIISLGMFEHVGYKNYRTYMEVVNRCLKDDGLFLLQTIGGNESEVSTEPWLDKYIFPNSIIPSIKQIGGAIEGLFVMEDWHNFSVDYDKTLMAWYGNFDMNWNKIKSKYDERFYRMWKHYLLSCAGSFRARKNQVWQIVFSKKGVPAGYRSIR
ncbi:MAG TPA: cyclopropane fatty acyl phospholipid synthase [Nitrospirae bacterium]|nr:cyclopropane fatty acyl phospholipid synthase [Nitrospirota bacterium]